MLKVTSLFFILLFNLPCPSSYGGSNETDCTQHTQAFVIDTPALFMLALSSYTSDNFHVSGLVGRVLKTTSNGKVALSSDPSRKIGFYLGSDGLEDLLKSDHRDFLHKLGYTEEYLLQQFAAQKKFRIFVTPDNSGFLPATWDNVYSIIEKLYPRVALKIQDKLKELKSMSFTQIDSLNALSIASIYQAGASHPQYISYQKLEHLEGNLWQVRAFLFNELRLTELFSGDGRTTQSDGKKGLTEYIGKNLQFDELDNYEINDLRVQ